MSADRSHLSDPNPHHFETLLSRVLILGLGGANPSFGPGRAFGCQRPSRSPFRSEALKPLARAAFSWRARIVVSSPAGSLRWSTRSRRSAPANSGTSRRKCWSLFRRCRPRKKQLIQAASSLCRAGVGARFSLLCGTVVRGPRAAGNRSDDLGLRYSQMRRAAVGADQGKSASFKRLFQVYASRTVLRRPRPSSHRKYGSARE